MKFSLSILVFAVTCSPLLAADKYAYLMRKAIVGRAQVIYTVESKTYRGQSYVFIKSKADAWLFGKKRYSSTQVSINRQDNFQPLTNAVCEWPKPVSKEHRCSANHFFDDGSYLFKAYSAKKAELLDLPSEFAGPCADNCADSNNIGDSNTVSLFDEFAEIDEMADIDIDSDIDSDDFAALDDDPHFDEPTDLENIIADITEINFSRSYRFPFSYRKRPDPTPDSPVTKHSADTSYPDFDPNTTNLFDLASIMMLSRNWTHDPNDANAAIDYIVVDDRVHALSRRIEVKSAKRWYVYLTIDETAPQELKDAMPRKLVFDPRYRVITRIYGRDPQAGNFIFKLSFKKSKFPGKP